MKKNVCLIIFVFIFSHNAFAGVLKTIQEAYELYSVGNYEEAAPIFEETFNITTKNSPNDTLGRFKIAVYAGLSYRGMEDYAKAVSWFETALKIASIMKDDAVKASVLAYIAESERLAGNYNKAVSAYLRAIGNEYISSRDKAVLYYGLAETYRLRGDHTKAKEACDMGGSLSTVFSMEQLKLSCDIVKGESYRMSGEYALALQSFGAVLDMSRARKYHELAIAALNGTGLTAEALGRYDTARGSFEEALALSIKNEIYVNVELLVDKISSLIPKGNFTKQADETVALIETDEILDSYTKAPLWRLAGTYYRASGDSAAAKVASQNAYEESLAATSQNETIASLYDIALAMYDLKKYYGAIIRLDEAVSRAKAANYAQIGKIYALKAECFASIDRLEEAYILMAEAAKYDGKFLGRLKQIEKIVAVDGEIRIKGDPDNITVTEEELQNDEDEKYEIEKTDETPVG